MGIDVTAIVESVSSSVVGVRSGRRHATGTLIEPGRIVTAAHNVRHGTVQIELADGDRLDGTVLGRSEHHDLAVVAADGAGVAIAVGDPASLAIGADVAAASAPGGALRVTTGAVATTAARLRTASGDPVANVVEHSAPLPGGSSGGPLLDAAGLMVGLNLNRVAGGLYQAVPTGPAWWAVVRRLAAGEDVAPKRLGVAVTPARHAARLRAAVGLEPREGALVAGVDPDGAAGRAGLGRGDLIVAVDDTPVSRPDDLLIALRDVGVSSTLRVARGDADPRQVEVVFADPASS